MNKLSMWRGRALVSTPATHCGYSPCPQTRSRREHSARCGFVLICAPSARGQRTRWIERRTPNKNGETPDEEENTQSRNNSSHSSHHRCRTRWLCAMFTCAQRSRTRKRKIARKTPKTERSLRCHWTWFILSLLLLSFSRSCPSSLCDGFCHFYGVYFNWFSYSRILFLCRCFFRRLRKTFALFVACCCRWWCDPAQQYSVRQVTVEPLHANRQLSISNTSTGRVYACRLRVWTQDKRFAPINVKFNSFTH